MLFNDGFNICAIVSGYEEVSNPWTKEWKGLEDFTVAS
jgi:hypothetical protein